MAAIEKIGGDYAKLAGGPYVKFTRDEKALGKPVIGVTFATGTGRWKEVTDAVCPEIAKFKDLQTLDLGAVVGPPGTQVTDAGIAQLKDLINLRSLVLPTSATDKSLEVVGRFNKLETLHILVCPITDKGVAELKPLKKLKTLTLSNLDANNSGGIVDALIHGGPSHTNNFTDRGLAHLAELPELQSLDISGNPRITGAGLAGFKSLKALNLNGNGLTDAGLKSLAQLKTLQTLNLNLSGNMRITDAGLAELQGLQHLLPSLDLSNTRVTDAGMKEVAALKGLQALNLNHTAVGDEGLAELKRLPALKSLEMRNTNVTDEGAKHLKQFTSLETVDLWGTLFTKSGLNELPHLKRLLAPVGSAAELGLKGTQSTESVTLGGGEITDRWLIQLTAFTSLRSLNLDSAEYIDLIHSGITDAGAKCLAELQSLKTIDLRGTQITDAGLKELQSLQNLKELNLCLVPGGPFDVTLEGIEELRAALPEAKILR